MNSIEGRAAIVTGSATGVGRETALTLAKRGCHVLINYSRSRAAAEATRAEVEGHGVRAALAQGDVARDADCRALVAAATDAFGRLDILVNNAGTTSFIKHDDLDAVGDDDWSRIMQVNVQGPFQMARAARSALEASGDGSVVNVSSIAGIRAIGSSIPYCASKAALNNLTVSLARVMAPKVRVNAVAPGFITGRWLTEGLGESYEAAKAGAEKRSPLGKVCEPSDVADAVLSLLTGSRLVTGQVIAVEGGMLIG
ncbi:MAG: SDR family oxidoreductase [Polyangiales bacterium]